MTKGNGVTHHNQVAMFLVKVGVGDHTSAELEKFVIESLQGDGWEVDRVEYVTLLDHESESGPDMAINHGGHTHTQKELEEWRDR